MAVMVKERRKAQRIPCRMPVSYKTIRSGGQAVETEQFVKAQTRDISEFGLGLVVNEWFSAGDIIRVDFALGGRNLQAVCEVMWANEIVLGENFPQYAIGLEFSCLTTEEQRYLDGYFRMRFESIWNFLLEPDK